MDVPQAVVDSIQRNLAIGSIAKTARTSRGYEIHIVASTGGTGVLSEIDREVSEAVRELRHAGALVDDLFVTVATWF
jgi:hypothetical protein